MFWKINMEEEYQLCPVCKKEIELCARHPNYICRECLRTYPKLNDHGEEVTFYNVSWTGGFICKNVKTGEINEEHICYINGVRCWADEYRFGGIVIEACTEYKKLN